MIHQDSTNRQDGSMHRKQRPTSGTFSLRGSEQCHTPRRYLTILAGTILSSFMLCQPAVAIDFSFEPDIDFSQQIQKTGQTLVHAGETLVKGSQNLFFNVTQSYPTNFLFGSSESSQEVYKETKLHDITAMISDNTKADGRGWCFRSGLLISEDYRFSDSRMAVQEADRRNQTNLASDTPLNETLNAFGISDYQITLEAEFLF